MFYTLTSKIPYIESDNSKRKILKIFLIGSVLYSMLHYHLFSNKSSPLYDNIKKYLYYIMIADFALSYFLMSKKCPVNKEDKKNNIENKYTVDEIKQIQYQQMQRAKMMQDLQRKQILLNQKTNSSDNEKSDVSEQKKIFKKKTKKDEENVNNEEREEKKESKENLKKNSEDKSDTSNDKKAKFKNKKMSDECSDTHIPVFVKK